MDPFLEGPFLEVFFMKSCSKMSNLMITELFYSHTVYMNRGSLHTRSLICIHPSVFRYRLTKNGFMGLNSLDLGL